MSAASVHNNPQGGNSPLRHALHVLATGMAGLGGIVIFGAALFVTLSVIRANLGMGSFRGEFELVELSCAACASLFLPLCQLTRGHVMVDVFTGWLPRPVNRNIDAFWTAIFAAVWILLCWRLFHGMLEIRGYGDRTMLLRAPIWWVYVPAVFGTGIAALMAIYMVVSDLRPSVVNKGEEV